MSKGYERWHYGSRARARPDVLTVPARRRADPRPSPTRLVLIAWIFAWICIARARGAATVV